MLNDRGCIHPENVLSMVQQSTTFHNPKKKNQFSRLIKYILYSCVIIGLYCIFRLKMIKIWNNLQQHASNHELKTSLKNNNVE